MVLATSTSSMLMSALEDPNPRRPLTDANASSASSAKGQGRLLNSAAAAAKTTTIRSSQSSTCIKMTDPPAMSLLPLLTKAEGVLQFQLITRAKAPLVAARARALKRHKLLDATANPNPSSSSDAAAKAHDPLAPSIAAPRTAVLDMIRTAAIGGLSLSCWSKNPNSTSTSTSTPSFLFYLDQLHAVEEKILFILLTLASPELFQLSANGTTVFLYPATQGQGHGTETPSLLDWTSRRFTLLKSLYHQRWNDMNSTQTPLFFQHVFNSCLLHGHKHNSTLTPSTVSTKKTLTLNTRRTTPTTTTTTPTATTTTTTTTTALHIHSSQEPFIKPDMNLQQRVQARALHKKTMQQHQQQQQLQYTHLEETSQDDNTDSIHTSSPPPPPSSSSSSQTIKINRGQSMEEIQHLIRFADSLRLFIRHKQGRRNNSNTLSLSIIKSDKMTDDPPPPPPPPYMTIPLSDILTHVSFKDATAHPKTRHNPVSQHPRKQYINNTTTTQYTMTLLQTLSHLVPEWIQVMDWNSMNKSTSTPSSSSSTSFSNKAVVMIHYTLPYQAIRDKLSTARTFLSGVEDVILEEKVTK